MLDGEILDPFLCRHLPSLLALAIALLLLGCESSTEPPKALSASISPTDTTIFAGDALTFEAVVEYESGPAAPDTVVWVVRDPGVLSLQIEEDYRATVTGSERGTSLVIATINERFVDSALVQVVRPGDTRWRVTVGATWQIPTPALDGQERVYVVHNGADGRVLSAFEPDGSLAYSVPTCPFSDMSPAVSGDGSAYVTGGWGCTQRHAPDGSVDWAFPLGSFDGGVAVASDGSVVLVCDEEPEWRNVVLSRISSEGIELWRDTLGPSLGGNVQKSAPLVNSTGDIYVAWSDTDGFWISRIGLSGVLVWRTALSGWSKRSTPALHGETVVVSYVNGVAGYDTMGALLWQRGDPGGHTSSPIIDPDGNIFIQSHSGLFSYDLQGNIRWSADSLGCYGCPQNAAAAPTLLLGGELVVPCDRDVCSVDTSDGSLIWRTAVDEPFNSPPAVASDGTIYVTTDQVLYALWGQRPPLAEGWPTEGGNMGRLRRRM